MARRRSFRFLAAAVSGQSHQREQGHWQRSAAHQQSDQYRLEDGGQHLAAKQNLSGSTIPSIPNQVGGAHRDQGHGRQAGPLGLPHAALRDEIRGPRSSLLRASTPRVTDQAPQGQSRKARIPSHPNTGGGLTRRSFWRECLLPAGPAAANNQPEEPVEQLEPWAWMTAFHHRKLLA